MKTVDIVSSALVFLVGLLLLFVIIPGWVPVESGPGFGLAATTMPYVAATTVTALAGMFFVYRLRDSHKRSETDDEYDADAPMVLANWLFLLRGALFLIAVTLLFEWFGFLVAGPPTVAGFMVMMGERRILPVAVTAIATTAAIWLFFWVFLQFPLP